MSKILVTGSSGFIGGHVLLQALQAGHEVVATVRSASKQRQVLETMTRAGAPIDALGFVTADLSSDDGWDAAVHGCDFVLHVASPMPMAEPKNPDDVIVPARDGVLRVLKAARDAKVKRVVLTSSCGAIYYGHAPQTAPFDETSWTNLDGQMSTYVRSKAIAERAAWDFMKREGGQLQLSVINPAAVFGPVLSAEAASSVEIIKRLLKGMPACPRLFFAVVDVRDVAELHLRAMTAPHAAGERFIAVSGESKPMIEVAKVLRERLGEKAKKVPTKEMPDWVVRTIGFFSASLRSLLPLLGVARNASSAKAQRVLGWKPRDAAEAIAASGESLLKLGVV